MAEVLVRISGLTVQRGGRNVLHIPSLEIKEGEVLAVIGPNGAGKSTLLLALSMLIEAAEGEIRFRGRQITRDWAEAYRRKIALVLQDALLLHDTVYNNVSAGLRFRGLPKAIAGQRVQDWLERLGIAALRERQAKTLSGGEAQRVSLARAFAIQSDLLLLDEPFSALDTPTRQALLGDFQSLLAFTRQTAVFITHDLEEALMLGDRVAVILGGELRQVGTPEEVLGMPADAEVAAFVGVETILPGQVISRREDLLQIQVDAFLVEAVGEIPIGREVYVCLRPEDITLWIEPDESSHTSSARNHLFGNVVSLVSQGPLTRVVVDCGFPLVSLITRASAREMSLQEGQKLGASFKTTAVHLIPR